MNLAEFHALVDTNLGEGGALDANIPTATRRAARWLERNYNLQHMKSDPEVYSYPAAQTPTPIDISGQSLPKAILEGEIREPGGFWALNTCAFTQSLAVNLDSEEFDGKFPLYMQNQTTLLPLLSTGSDLDIVLVTLRYTLWPTSNYDQFTNWLLDNADDVLEAQTCLFLAPVARDPGLKAFYESIRNEGLKTLQDADLAFAIEVGDAEPQNE